MGRLAVIWILIIAAVLVVLWIGGRVRGRPADRPGHGDETAEFFAAKREAASIVDQNVDQLYLEIKNLPVVADPGVGGATVAFAGLRENIRAFVGPTLRTAVDTSTTDMVRAVRAMDRFTIFAKTHPLRGKRDANVREFVRTGDDAWTYRSRTVADIESAAAEATRLGDQIAERYSQRQTAARTEPTARNSMLWFGAPVLERWRAALESGRDVAYVSESGEPRDLVATVEDIDWALSVDRIAGQAENAAHAGDLVEAIRLYQSALDVAPDAAVYLMSIGTCYGQLGALADAIRYYERAAAIEPDNERIRKNLEAARQATTQGY
jgi:hypothetical protein